MLCGFDLSVPWDGTPRSSIGLNQPYHAHGHQNPVLVPQKKNPSYSEILQARFYQPDPDLSYSGVNLEQLH